MSSTVLAAVLTSAFLIPVLSYVVYRIIQYVSQFSPLPGFPKSQVVLSGAAKAEDVAKALDYAAQCLARNGPWKSAQVVEVTLSGVVIVVMPVNSWMDGFGRKVAGTQSIGGDGTVPWLQVGQNLAALCHELAHACEHRIDGKVDETHATWTERGLFRAVDVYQTRYPG